LEIMARLGGVDDAAIRAHLLDAIEQLEPEPCTARAVRATPIPDPYSSPVWYSRECPGGVPLVYDQGPPENTWKGMERP